MYDEVIVGAGSCGGVLASRLSEDPDRTVVLIEAGPWYTDVASMPVDLTRWFSSFSAHDWHLSATVRDGRVVPYPRGKVVGGCSAVNCSIALRNDPAEWDEWAGLGFPSWRWEVMLPYFCRLENDPQGYAVHPDAHGLDGPLPVRHVAESRWQPLHRSYIEACLDYGIGYAPDLNAPGAHGVGVLPRNLIDGVRQSVAVTYLAEAASRPNLTVRPGVLVDRVVLDRGRAIGVEIIADGHRERVEGRRISLAAGAIGTPPILVRSGIGAAAAVRALDIEVAADLPGVGATLRDHPSCGIPAVPAAAACHDPSVFVEAAARITSEGSPGANDVQLSLFTMFDLAQVADVHPVDSPLVFLGAALMRPASYGSLTVTSSDPAVAPRIDCNFLACDEDMRRMVAAWQLSRQLSRLEPLRSMIGACLVPDDVIADDLACARAIAACVNTTYHPQSTAPMGKDPGQGAVVDGEGRVYGVDGLRIVDISVMPVSANANTNLAAIAIAEHMADLMAARP